MIRSAPSCLAARTPSRPTAPSPTTATVLPGPASAATAPNQPVPSTSEAASRLGIRSSAGMSGGGDQGAVGQRDPQRTRPGLPMAPMSCRLHAGGLVAGPADLAGVVGGEERADHELAGLDAGDLAADLLDDADVLVAHRGGSVDWLDAAVGPQVGPAHAGGGDADDRVGGFDDRAGRSRSSTRTSPGAWRMAPRIMGFSLKWWLMVPEEQGGSRGGLDADRDLPGAGQRRPDRCRPRPGAPSPGGGTLWPRSS